MAERIIIELVGGPECGRIVRDREPGQLLRTDHRGTRFTYAGTTRYIEGRQVYEVSSAVPLDTPHPAWLRRQP